MLIFTTSLHTPHKNMRKLQSDSSNKFIIFIKEVLDLSKCTLTISPGMCYNIPLAHLSNNSSRPRLRQMQRTHMLLLYSARASIYKSKGWWIKAFTILIPNKTWKYLHYEKRRSYRGRTESPSPEYYGIIALQSSC